MTGSPWIKALLQSQVHYHSLWFLEGHGSLDIEKIEVKIEITFSVVMGRRWNRLSARNSAKSFYLKQTTETIFPPVPSWGAREEGLHGCEASLFWPPLASLPWNSYKHRNVPFASLEDKDKECRCSNHTECLDEPPKGLKTGIPTAWMGLERQMYQSTGAPHWKELHLPLFLRGAEQEAGERYSVRLKGNASKLAIFGLQFKRSPALFTEWASFNPTPL